MKSWLRGYIIQLKNIINTGENSNMKFERNNYGRKDKGLCKNQNW